MAQWYGAGLLNLFPAMDIQVRFLVWAFLVFPPPYLFPDSLVNKEKKYLNHTQNQAELNRHS